MRKTVNRILAAGILLFVLLPGTAIADDWYEPDPGYFTLVDEQGKELTVMAREIFKDDEYISGDNKHYKVVRVDKAKRYAYAKLVGEITLPAAAGDGAYAAAQQQKGNIVLYATHNDESYVPSDGKESIKGKGGILDVAESFRANLEKKGIKAFLDKTSHDPHDAGSYRRSRQTAVKLIKANMPVAAAFDIHRDAVPKSHYVTEVDGQDMVKVRIVIGRRNQNRQANQELAQKIKSVADKTYPGLIKDIFIGRGSYNQELSPRALLFEIGTHENTKEAAQKTTAYLADIVSKAMFGGTAERQSRKTGESTGDKSRIKPIDQEKTSGGGRGLLWLLIVLVVGGIGFLFVSMGGREMFSKVSKSARQEFSSFLGRNKRNKR